VAPLVAVRRGGQGAGAAPVTLAAGTASLWLDTAGASGSLPLCLRYLPDAEARALQAQLGDALARRRLHW